MAGAVFALLVIVIVVVIASVASPGGQYDKLVARGLPARGILLQVAPRGTRIGTSARRFERRAVVIDVEVPGQPPFEVSAQPYIPLNLVRDVLPGATVELRVDPKNGRNLAIVGPGVGIAQSVVRTA